MCERILLLCRVPGASDVSYHAIRSPLIQIDSQRAHWKSHKASCVESSKGVSSAPSVLNTVGSQVSQALGEFAPLVADEIALAMRSALKIGTPDALNKTHVVFFEFVYTPSSEVPIRNQFDMINATVYTHQGLIQHLADNFNYSESAKVNTIRRALVPAPDAPPTDPPTPSRCVAIMFAHGAVGNGTPEAPATMILPMPVRDATFLPQRGNAWVGDLISSLLGEQPTDEKSLLTPMILGHLKENPTWDGGKSGFSESSLPYPRVMVLMLCPCAAFSYPNAEKAVEEVSG